MTKYERFLATYERQFFNPPDPRTEALRRIAAMPSEHDFTQFGYSQLVAAMAKAARDALENNE